MHANIFKDEPVLFSAHMHQLTRESYWISPACKVKRSVKAETFPLFVEIYCFRSQRAAKILNKGKITNRCTSLVPVRRKRMGKCVYDPY